MSFNTNSVILLSRFHPGSLETKCMKIVSASSSPEWRCEEDAESLLITTEWNNINEKYTWPKAYWRIKLKGNLLYNWKIARMFTKKLIQFLWRFRKCIHHSYIRVFYVLLWLLPDVSFPFFVYFTWCSMKPNKRKKAGGGSTLFPAT